MRRLLPLLLLLPLAGLALAKQPGRRKPDPQRGRDFYQRSCWQCHGKRALGDGPAAASLSSPVPRLRGVEQARFPELVRVIQEGRGAMPGFAATIDRHDSRRILVYLASLDARSEPPPARKAGKPEEEPEAPAEDAPAD